MKFVNEILSCYRSNEMSLAELLYGIIYFLEFYEKKLRFFGESFRWPLKGVNCLKTNHE